MHKNKHNKKHIGNKYEAKAVDLLLQKGYYIYGQNIHINRREIDILAIDHSRNIAIIVEVKYRKLYFPNLSQKQINNLQEAGTLLYQLDASIPIFWRIDLIVFLDEKMFYYENLHLNS